MAVTRILSDMCKPLFFNSVLLCLQAFSNAARRAVSLCLCRPAVIDTAEQREEAQAPAGDEENPVAKASKADSLTEPKHAFADPTCESPPSRGIQGYRGASLLRGITGF